MALNFNMGSLMKEAKKLQDNLQDMQKEMDNQQFTGEAGAGLVKVVLTGNRMVISTTIDKSLLTGDIDVLQDLISGAMNHALSKIEEASKSKLGALSSMMPGAHG